MVTRNSLLLSRVSHQAIAAWIVTSTLVVVSSGWAQPFTVVNVIPNSQSAESQQNSEPNIAVNPQDPNQIVISAFNDSAPNNPAGPQPYFLSTNGGTRWANLTNNPHHHTSVAWSLGGSSYAAL